MESKYIEVTEGKLHYKAKEKPDQTKPYVLFLHGASPKSQHTEFWTPILSIINKYTNPLLLDRFGHGQSKLNDNSIAISRNLHIGSVKNFLDHILAHYNIKTIAIVGRSLGGAIALELFKSIPEKISGLGLIAPAGTNRYLDVIETLNIPTTVLWDINDPVVTFNGNEIIKRNNNISLYTIGQFSQAKKWIPHEGIKKSHAPELNAPELFEEFLASLCQQIS